MNDTVIEIMKQRRSVRKYKPELPPKDMLDEILDAGQYAPTGMNRQKVILVAVTDKDTIRKLSSLNASVMGGSGDPFYGAPCVIVVFADKDVSTCVEDGALAIGNMMNAAASLGLGSCWIHRAREVFSSDEGHMLMKKWGVSDNNIGIGHCILGYPDVPALGDKERAPGRIIKIN